jgi:CheY-like chemotaxis protein
MAKHILIVDDQHEVRRMLRAGIETLGPEFRVLDLPSAEESLVVISTQSVDLLITDIGLPGISGLELMQKVRKRNPDLKLILITGLPDPNIRQSVANAGAEAHFIKPVPMAAFLQAVQKALSEAGVPAPTAPQIQETTRPAETMPERLDNHRQSLEAQAVILLNEWGGILARAGELPGGASESTLIPSLLSALAAGGKLSISMGNSTPDNLLFIKGSQYNLCAIKAGMDYALLVILQSKTVFSTPLVEALYPAVQDLLAMLEGPLSPLVTLQQPEIPPPDESEVFQAENGNLEEILTEELAPKISPTDLDQFWDNLTENNPARNSSDAGVITYEQARKLGLTPQDS